MTLYREGAPPSSEQVDKIDFLDDIEATNDKKGKKNRPQHEQQRFDKNKRCIRLRLEAVLAVRNHIVLRDVSTLKTRAFLF